MKTESMPTSLLPTLEPMPSTTDLRSLSDAVLLSTTLGLVREERRLTLSILHHLREVERRRLAAARGFQSLFDYCTRELGYSAGSAQRRIESMRLLKELPEMEAKLQSGGLNLSLLSQASRFFRQEKMKKPSLRFSHHSIGTLAAITVLLTASSALATAPGKRPSSGFADESAYAAASIEG